MTRIKVSQIHFGKCMECIVNPSVVLLVVVFLLWFPVAMAQQETTALQLHRSQLEVQKLELEIARLKEELVVWPKWITPLIGLGTGILGGVLSFFLARLARGAALDQATHAKRLECYPELVKATSRLAVYFPRTDPNGTASIGPDECSAIGRAMSKWYFDAGGLLLSVEARDAYFKLARALTRASSAKALWVPTFPRDAGDISNENVNEYRIALKKTSDLDNVEAWNFGSAKSVEKAPASALHLKYKDYVFLQTLSSRLRTMLSEDLRSRRRPNVGS